MKSYILYLSIISLVLPVFGFGQGNYIRTRTPNIAITDETSIEPSAQNAVGDVMQTTKYFDGFGRPIQTVAKGMSPMGKDVVNMYVYDNWGRETKKYMPFVSATDDGNFKINALSNQEAFNQNMFPNEADKYYSEVELENSPLNRTLKTLVPGANWVGSSRGTSMRHLVNTSEDEVRIWDISNTLGATPLSSGHYLSGSLYKTITTGVDGLQTIEFKNKEGQIVLTKQQFSASSDDGSGSSHSGWRCTYYVYDGYGNLRYIIPPKAVEILDNGSWSISQAVIDGLCFRYEYDAKGRTIVKQSPGAGEVYFVYDNRDRPVFEQDAVQRIAHQWSIIFYDGLDRAVETGIYTDATATRESLQNTMDAIGGTGGNEECPPIPAPDDLVVSSRTGNQPAEYIARNSITFMPGFEAPAGDEFTTIIDPDAMIDDPDCEEDEDAGSTENPVPPVSSSSVTPLTYTYYDDYDWNGHQSFKSNYLSKTTAADNPHSESPSTYDKKTRGHITGTKVKILGSSPEQWLITTTYYDDKGRALQTLTDNHTGGTDITTNRYDFSGKLLSSYMVNQNNNSTITPETNVLTENKYDEGGRLLTITKTINDEASTKRVIATHTYDELSQLKTLTLGDDLETLHYDYNIRGWLTGINRGYTTQGNTAHYFGMELGYDKSTTENGTTTFTPRYDGNISGTIWKGKGDETARKYDFSYDNADRLTTAEFNQNSSGSSWDHNTVDFSVNNIAYDINGNISKLSQHGLKGNNSPLIDDLEYDYQTNSNKLLKVTDDANDPATTLGDFHDGSNSGNDYSYDANGNLTKDLNKSISSITYNDLNLPEEITFTGNGSAGSPSGTVEFTYDAVGNKLQKTVTDQTASPAKTVVTNYVDGFVYTHTGSATEDTLQFFPTESGRVRYLSPLGGTQGGFVYDYFIMDHLGNTRMVLTEQTDFSHYLATLETDKAATEEALFYNLNSTRVPTPMSYPKDDITGPNQSVAKLNGKDPDKRIGPSIILKVMAGDTIQAAVRAYYKKQTIPKKKASIPAEQMLTGLVQALVAPGMQAIATHGGDVLPDQQLAAPGLTANDLRQLKQQNPESVPENKLKAYLNYVFFDKQLNFVEEGSGVKQVEGEAGELETLSSGKVVVQKDGYVYIFASNESQQDVFFDNLGVTQITGPILEETHYYPFGLTMAGISTVAPLKIANQFKYQGKELQNKEFADGSGLEWYDFEARYYDPQLGRWWSQDPAGQFGSPYLAMGNNPLLYSDPDGQFAWFVPIVIGAVLGGTSGAIGASMEGSSVLGGLWRGALVGAAGGAMSLIGGAGMSFAANLALGTGEGAATGALNAALWGNDIGKGALWGAASGAAFTTITSDNLNNAIKGKGFKTNSNVFNDFAADEYTSTGGKWQQDALDYFGLEGTYAPDFVNEYGGGAPAFTDSKTGQIFYNKFSFEDNFDRLNLIADHEMQHRLQILSGKYNTDNSISLNTGEWEAYLHNYKNQGLYPSHRGTNLIERINSYGIKAGIYGMTISPHGSTSTLFSKRWWQFIYKIPRRW